MPTSDLPIGFLSGFFGWLSQKRIHGTNGERYIYLLIYLFEINPIHVGILYIYIYLIPMDPMAKKSHVEDSLPYVLNPSSLEGFQSRKTQVPWKGSGSWKPTALRAYHIFNCSGKFRLEARESPKRISMSLPSQLALLTLIYTVSHTSQQKSLWQNGSGGLNMCLFQGGIFPEKPHPPIKNPSQFFFDVVFSAAKITTWSPISSPSLYQQQPSTRGSVTSCQPP